MSPRLESETGKVSSSTPPYRVAVSVPSCLRTPTGFRGPSFPVRIVPCEVPDSPLEGPRPGPVRKERLHTHTCRASTGRVDNDVRVMPENHGHTRRDTGNSPSHYGKLHGVPVGCVCVGSNERGDGGEGLLGGVPQELRPGRKPSRRKPRRHGSRVVARPCTIYAHIRAPTTPEETPVGRTREVGGERD